MGLSPYLINEMRLR